MDEWHDLKMGETKRMECGHLVTPQEKTMADLLAEYYGREPLDIVPPEYPPDTLAFD